MQNNEMMDFKIPKYSEKERKEREDEREKKKRKEEAEEKYLQDKKRRNEKRNRRLMRQWEERERRHLRRKSAINWGQAKVRAMAMKEADLNPLPSKVIRRAEMDGKGEEARKEVRRRREGRREAGLRGEQYFKHYRTIVQTTGLNRGDMLPRVELLRNSLAHDFQVGVDKIYSNLHCIHSCFQGLTIGHLAKTLALANSDNLAEAEVEMKKWGQWAKVQKGKEQTRWKEASIRLEVFKGTSLNGKQFKAARKVGVNKNEVENFIKNARKKSSAYLYLFDKDDIKLLL